jgi:hypothetical protein
LFLPEWRAVAGDIGWLCSWRYHPHATCGREPFRVLSESQQGGGYMAEKLTMKSLSVELEALSKKVSQLERQMNRKIETAVKKTLDEAIGEMGSGRGKEGHGAGVDAAERQRLIAEAAYLMAERRGFEQGDPAQDWINAEEEINCKLLQGESS